VNNHSFPNLENWQSLNDSDRLYELLSLARLSPSVHNTQPWKVSIQGNHSFKLYLDEKVDLRFSDPSKRETFISLGAFLETFMQALKAYGGSCELHFNPPGSFPKTDLVATVSDITYQSVDQIDSVVLQAITERRTYRGAYKNEVPTLETIKKLAISPANGTSLNQITDKKIRERVVKLVSACTAFGFSNAKFRGELADYIIPNSSAREDGIPGYAANFGNLASHIVPHAIKRYNVGSWQAGNTTKSLMSAPLLCVITSTTDFSHGWMEAGRTLVRYLLEATKHSLAIGVWAAPVEAPMAADALRKMVSAVDRPQVLLSIGYPAQKLPPHSPRKALSRILVQTD
jgi:hypothetical protein